MNNSVYEEEKKSDSPGAPQQRGVGGNRPENMYRPQTTRALNGFRRIEDMNEISIIKDSTNYETS